MAHLLPYASHVLVERVCQALISFITLPMRIYLWKRMTDPFANDARACHVCPLRKLQLLVNSEH